MLSEQTILTTKPRISHHAAVRCGGSLSRIAVELELNWRTKRNKWQNFSITNIVDEHAWEPMVLKCCARDFIGSVPSEAAVP